MRVRILTILALAALVAVLGGGVAAAQQDSDDYPVDTPDSDVLGDSDDNDGNEGDDGGDAAEAGSAVDAEVLSNSAGLPVTGGDVIALTAIGVALIGVGAVLVRRRSAQS